MRTSATRLWSSNGSGRTTRRSKPWWILTRSATPSIALLHRQIHRQKSVPVSNPQLPPDFEGKQSAWQEGISSRFNEVGRCTSRQNSGLAQREKAEIFFGDAAHMRSDHHAGRTWGKRGATPIVETTGARHRMSLISAITARGHMRFMIKDKGGVNAAVFIEFLKRLMAAASGSGVDIFRPFMDGSRDPLWYLAKASIGAGGGVCDRRVRTALAPTCPTSMLPSARLKLPRFRGHPIF